MKVEHSDNSHERAHLVSFITDAQFLALYAPRWGEGKFRSPQANTLGSLCVHYFLKYHRPPREKIVDLFRRWAEGKPKEQVEQHDRLLASLSDQIGATASNTPYSVDAAADYFDAVALDKLADNVKAAVAAGRTDLARQLCTGFRPVEVGSQADTDLFRDEEGMIAAYEEDKRGPVIRMPGPSGHFFREPFKPRSLVVFAARQKVGKSTWLRKVAYTGMLQRQKVGFIGVGDLTKEEIYRGMGTLNARRPHLSTNQDGSWPCSVSFPASITPPDGDRDDLARVEFTEKKFTKPLSGKRAWELINDTHQEVMGTIKSHFKLHVASARSLTIAGVRGILDSWIAGGFVPSVLVLDYADNLAHTDNKLEYRHRVSEVWMGLSAIRMDYHLLLVTATQVKSTSFHKKRDNSKDKILTDEDVWRESAGILDNVTGICAINQTPQEKALGVYRLSWPVMRGWQFDERRCLYCAGCLAVGDPCLVSSF